MQFEKRMRCSLNIIKFVSKLFILVLFMVSCEEESNSSSNETVDVNTLGHSSLGHNEGVFSDYFLYLSSDFNAKFGPAILVKKKIATNEYWKKLTLLLPNF